MHADSEPTAKARATAAAHVTTSHDDAIVLAILNGATYHAHTNSTIMTWESIGNVENLKLVVKALQTDPPATDACFRIPGTKDYERPELHKALHKLGIRKQDHESVIHDGVRCLSFTIRPIALPASPSGIAVGDAMRAVGAWPTPGAKAGSDEPPPSGFT